MDKQLKLDFSEYYYQRIVKKFNKKPELEFMPPIPKISHILKMVYGK